MVRTAERLMAEGTRVALVDLTDLGTLLNEQQWYLGLLEEVIRQLGFSKDVAGWWRERIGMGSAHRMFTFLAGLMEEELQGQDLVLFVDEVDCTRGLSFTDEFFAAVRSLYEARARRESLKRLSVVLLGAATPSDLIKDARWDPFTLDAAHRVELGDFTYEEALPLAAGLGLPEEAARQVLHWVMEWTGGHPYLTQRICRELAQEPPPVTREKVDGAVARLFLGERGSRDSNLQLVRDMLTKEDWAPDARAVINAYLRVLRGRPVADDERSPIRAHLRLSGVVKGVDGRLVVRNQLYRTVFDEAWARERRPPFDWKRFATGLARRLAVPAAVLAAALAVVVIGLLWNRAQKAEQEAYERAMAQLSAIQELDFVNEQLRGESVLFEALQKEMADSIAQDRHSSESERRALAARLAALQASHESGMLAERSRCDQAVTSKDAALADAGVQAQALQRHLDLALQDLRTTRDDLQAARQDVQTCTRSVNAAGALRRRIYGLLAFPKAPEPSLPELSERPDRPFAFIKAPSYVTVKIDPCNTGIAVEGYRLNDLATSGSVEGQGSSSVASAIALPGGFDAIANAARGGFALHLVQGRPGEYLAYYEDHGVRMTGLLDLKTSGQVLDLTTESTGPTPRCR